MQSKIVHLELKINGKNINGTFQVIDDVLILKTGPWSFRMNAQEAKIAGKQIMSLLGEVWPLVETTWIREQ